MISSNFSEKKIFIVDASSFLYRAYYAIKPMNSPQGQPVHAVYGFCRMIKKLLNNHHPHYLVLAWDAPGTTERHEIFADYKITRQQTPNDLQIQKELIARFANDIGIVQVQKSGIEADDIMYSLAQDFVSQGYTVVLVSTDKDLGQMVNDAIVLYDPFKEIFLDTQALHQKYTFSPQKLSFFFALTGDQSDNIPGVSGIGPKTATEIVNQFTSLQELYEAIDQIPRERTRTLLLANKHHAFLSEQLFLLRYHHLDISPEECRFHEEQWTRARDFFKELNFASLLKDMPETPNLMPSVKYHFSYITITGTDQLKQICAEIVQAGACAIDTETDSLMPYQAQLIGISIAYCIGQSFYIPLNHRDTTISQISKDDVEKILKPLLENRNIKKYLHHAKFDQLVLSRYGIELQGIAFDTMIAAYLISPEQQLSLKSLSFSYLQQDMLTYENLMAQGKYTTFADVPCSTATEYAAGDAHQTLQLTYVLQKILEQEHQLRSLFDMELLLSQVLYAMEKEGIMLHTAVLDIISQQVATQIAIVHKNIVTMLGEAYQEVNLNSPKQVEEILFEHLKLTPLKKTAKKTAYSTDQEVLQELAQSHPVPSLIITYRELCKLKGTYIDTLPTYINPYTKRIHTNFRQTATATGRLASANPNLQNIPTGSMAGVQPLRSAFIATEDHVFFAADYSQIELRILAYLTGDANLTHAFLHNEDIHARTAAGLFHVPLDLVTHEQRQIGKRINFSILYGLTPYGLSKDLRISYHDAENYIKRYFAQYPSVESWMTSIVEETKTHGYVSTLYGRRRYIPDIYQQNKPLYELAQRVAINTKVQGTAADLMKLAMIKLHTHLQKQCPAARLIIQIHDELLLSIPQEILEPTESIVVHILQGIVDWHIPLVVTTRSGKTWSDVTK